MNDQAVADSDLEHVQMECLAVSGGDGEPVVSWWERDGFWWTGHPSADGITVPAARFDTEAQAEAWAHGWLAGAYPGIGDTRFCAIHGTLQ